MVARIVRWCVEHRWWVLVGYLGLGAWGWWALRTTTVDAIPDLSDQQVIVFTDWMGHSPQEVEDQITYPLSSNLEGLAGVRTVRGQSAFGFSMIYVVFNDDVDLYFARTRVLERLALAGKLLPEGVSPTLGPDATGVGHVFWYTVESDAMSLRDLRSLQDWFIRYQLQSVPGVAEVASVGGTVKQYQIDVDPERLRSYHISLEDILRAVKNSNANVGGNVLEANGTWSIVRGLGLVESPQDLADIGLRATGGVPIRLGEVADVRIGDAFRVASLVKGTREAVGGVVVARAGANVQQVIDGIKARLRELEPGLPAGVHIVPFYDRSELIGRVLGTLRKTLLEEIALVTLAHVVFLLHVRSILIVTLPLPLAVLLSFLGMRYAGISSNLMSLAGIAIAIGVLVDAAIVVTENAFRTVGALPATRRTPTDIREAVIRSLGMVGRPVLFSMAIIVLAFVPVFGLTGQEGKLFHPLAFTKTFAVTAATIIAVTLVPALCTWLLGGRLHAEERNPVMRALQRAYRPVLSWGLDHGAWTLTIATALLAGAIVLFTRMGSEFMPPLNEGDLMFMPIADPSVSLAQNTDIAKRQNAALLAFPEVDSVVAKVARADTSTDPAPLNMTETIVHLKPPSTWPAGLTLDQLRGNMSRAVALPGVATIWTMPIINRIDMLTTGIRSEVGVKVFGSDLTVLQTLANRIADVVRTVPGATNVYPEPLTGAQYLNVRVDRMAAARYGLSVADVEDVISYGVGETPLGMVIDGRQRFPIRVRLAASARKDAADLRDIPLVSDRGGLIPLGSVTTIAPTRGPAMISSENGLLYATVLLNVQGRDVGGFVAEAGRALQQAVPMPTGYYATWSGRYQNEEHANARLRVLVPIVIVTIFLVLVISYRSLVEAAHVLLAVPFALTGGIYLTYLLHYNFSVAVWVGFIALFGTAVQTSVVMVVYLNEAVERRLSLGRTLTSGELREAVIEGALLRLRPKVMTVSTIVAGLLPIMWSADTGSEVMRPLAAPVLGGMVSSLFHVLVVTPVLFLWIAQRRLAVPAAARQPVQASAGRRSRRMLLMFATLFLAVVALTVWSARHRAPQAPATVVAAARSGSVEIQLLSPLGAPHQGRNELLLRFRDAASHEAIDPGDIRASVAMSMPGMSMSPDLSIAHAAGPGEYEVVTSFPMIGVWRWSVTWTGLGGGSVQFDGEVR